MFLAKAHGPTVFDFNSIEDQDVIEDDSPASFDDAAMEECGLFDD